MPTFCSSYVLLVLFFQLLVLLKWFVMNTLVHFVLRQSAVFSGNCRILRNVFLGGPHNPFLGLIKSSYRGWLSMMTSSEGPFSTLSQDPPILSPPLCV